MHENSYAVENNYAFEDGCLVEDVLWEDDGALFDGLDHYAPASLRHVAERDVRLKEERIRLWEQQGVVPSRKATL